MGRPPKYPVETKADIIDKLVKEIDPEIILAGMLGGVAAANGVIPPLTRILMAFSDSADGLVADYKKLLIAGTGVGPIYAVLGNMFTDTSSNDRPPTNTGIAASGALEAMIVMSFVKNPEMVKAVVSSMKDVAGGVKGAVPFLP